MNRVTTRTYSGAPPGSTTPGVTYIYDGTATLNLKGRLTSVSSSVSSYSYGSYDVVGRVSAKGWRSLERGRGVDCTTSFERSELWSSLNGK
ncbi:MAG: hypothetical protein AABN33_20510 [Acidobacteriota bacterium]